jgi:hypothetical protein
MFVIEAYALDCNIIKENVYFETENSIAYRTQNTIFGDENDFSSRTSFNNRINLKLYNVTFDSDIDLYSISNPNSNLHNISVSYGDEMDKTYQINSLNISLNINEYITLYHGVIPFRGGKFAEIKDPTVNGGNGLPILQNQTYMSDFISIHNDSTSFKVGSGEYLAKLHYHGVLEENDKSNGVFSVLSHETGKHYFEINYYDMNILINSTDYAKVKLGGIGYIYDDSLNSGLTFYTNLGYVKAQEKVSVLSPDYAKEFLRKARYQVDDYSSSGYAGLVGLNYEFDRGDLTYNVGVEEFITRGEWVSANFGNRFLSDYSFVANKKAFETSIYGGVNFTKNFRVSSKITHTESENVSGSLSLGKTVQPEEAPLGSIFHRYFTKIELLFNYVF